MKKTSVYTVDWNTIPPEEFTGTLGEAMELADAGMGYTQQDITIANADGEIVARRRWWGLPYEEGDDYTEEQVADDVVLYGDFGWYARWRVNMALVPPEERDSLPPEGEA